VPSGGVGPGDGVPSGGVGPGDGVPSGGVGKGVDVSTTVVVTDAGLPMITLESAVRLAVSVIVSVFRGRTTI
jgi:hypothetical protein